MGTKVNIAGKERELYRDSQFHRLWFLSKKDSDSIGIHCGLTLSQWNNPGYLRKLLALSHHLY